jgi:hypothetical protein
MLKNVNENIGITSSTSACANKELENSGDDPVWMTPERKRDAGAYRSLQPLLSDIRKIDDVRTELLRVARLLHRVIDAPDPHRELNEIVEELSSPSLESRCFKKAQKRCTTYGTSTDFTWDYKNMIQEEASKWL